MSTTENEYFSLSKSTFLIRGSIDKNQCDQQVCASKIWVDGVELTPETGTALRPFYQCRFEWGSESELSSNITALCICIAIFKEQRIAENLFVCFKDDFVAYFPTGNFEIEIDVKPFLLKYETRLYPDIYSRFCFSARINSREILLYKDPVSGIVSADIAANYAIYNNTIADPKLRREAHRKQRLVYRLFFKDNYIITGKDFSEVTGKLDEIMSVFYWKSMERILKRRF